VTHFEYLHPHSRSGLIRLADAAGVAGHLRRGSLAILPTETGYLLAALATSIPATERAFEVKRRAAAQVMHVACSSLTMAGEAGQLNTQARRILGDFTPGPVSVIVPQTDLLPDRLVTLNGTVGLRIPDHPATLQVISELGQPVTATSLNESGSLPGPLDTFDLKSLNWRADETVYVVVDDESIRYDAASTLVRVTGADVEVLRPGPVTDVEICRAVGE
jgi:L-threonylcarbamoyladenylate synthase